MTKIWAHRGASAYATENTMSAFELAVAQKADGIELDVQMTKDGVVVVHHDETVDRIWIGAGAIKHHTYEQLKALDAKTDRLNQRVYIPTLLEVLTFCASVPIEVNIELKNSVEQYAGMEEKVLELVKATNMVDKVLYSSFNHASMVRIKALDASARTGLLYSGILADPWIYAKHIGAFAIHPSQNSLSIGNLTRDCHDSGVIINVWTIDDPKVMRFCFEQGVDGIITNTPDIAKALGQ